MTCTPMLPAKSLKILWAIRSIWIAGKPSAGFTKLQVTDNSTVPFFDEHYNHVHVGTTNQFILTVQVKSQSGCINIQIKMKPSDKCYIIIIITCTFICKLSFICQSYEPHNFNTSMKMLKLNLSHFILLQLIIWAICN